MSMLAFYHRVGKDFAVDYNFLYEVRKIKDGITFFEFKCNWDRYEDDHKPSLDLELIIFNIIIFEINIYNIHHKR